MRWLKVLMPRRVGDLIPAGGYVPDKALTAERDAVRQTAMLNLAIIMALVYIGALVGQTMDMASYRDAAYTTMITGLDSFLNIDYGSRFSVIAGLALVLLLSALVCLLPLVLLAWSDLAGFLAALLVAPVFGIWIMGAVIQSLNLVNTAFAALAISVGALVFMSGRRVMGVITALVLIAVAQPWGGIGEDPIRVLGTVLVLGLLLPSIVGGACVRGAMAVCQQDSSELNEYNAPVVAFSLFALSVCTVFVVNVVYAFIQGPRKGMPR